MASKLNAANKKNIDAPILLLMGGYAAPTIELKIQSIKIESDWAADLKNCLNKKNARFITVWIYQKARLLWKLVSVPLRSEMI